MQYKKGQAAMEFLMTYGWAILAAIVAIGVLAYFGVFSPGKLAGSSAILNNPFYANSWQVSNASLKIEALNNGGDSLVVDKITVTGTGASVNGNCNNDTIGTNNAVINPGVPALLSTACASMPASGSNYAGNIQIIYHKSGSTLNQTITGTIRSTVI